MPIELIVPTVGESISEVQIGEWLKSEGDWVEKDQSLVEIESDKATVEIPAPVSGRLGKLLKQRGDTAAVGECIGYMEASDAPATDAPAGGAAPVKAAAEQGKATAVPAKSAEKAPAPASSGDAATGHVMPAAARALAETGLSAKDVTATGPGGRILKEDVQRQAAAKEVKAPDSKSAAAAAGTGLAKPAPRPAAGRAPAVIDARSPANREEEIVPMSPIRRRIAERLVQAQQSAALLTTFNEVDMTEVKALREQHKDHFQTRYGVKLGFMSFFIKAAIEALRSVPQVNTEIRGTDIVHKYYYDVGVAVGGGKGLVVPVIRNAERMSFGELELAIGDFARRAQDNKIKLEELQGGTFTISNGGVYGSLLSTPIVNPPQSGILGLHAIQDRPVALNGQVVIRPMMYLALTYDHRVVDGREAVTFLKRIKECIESPSRLLLEI